MWLGGVPKKRIAAQLGLNVKTVRRYLAASPGRRPFKRIPFAFPPYR
ncbi:MAG: hypothetical protein HYS14_06565 [Candidatus Rokubacteria bacterium]|nr:hypothetical protein [Candidatus Rokubacteria bacterium]